MGAYISRCWNPPAKGGTSGAPTPENGALAATSTQSAEGPSATTTQVVGPASPGAASPEAAEPHAPAPEGVEPGSTTTPRVDTQMSFPISIADDDDDGIPKRDAKGNMSSAPKPIPPPEDPPPPKPKPGVVKQRFRLPFGGTNEE